MVALKPLLHFQLLEHEKQAAEQVPLLLAMKEDRLALAKAVKSNNPDLVFHVLLNLRARLTPGDFFALVDDGSPQLAPAVGLLQVYAKENDRDLLRDLYYQDDRRLDSALLELEEGWAKEVSRKLSTSFFSILTGLARRTSMRDLLA